MRTLLLGYFQSKTHVFQETKYQRNKINIRKKVYQLVNLNKSIVCFNMILRFHFTPQKSRNSCDNSRGKSQSGTLTFLVSARNAPTRPFGGHSRFQCRHATLAEQGKARSGGVNSYKSLIEFFHFLPFNLYQGQNDGQTDRQI